MQVCRAAGALGAFIEEVSLAEAARDAGLFAEVRAALLEHQVLFIRDQQISAQDYQTFARRFGAVEPHPAYDVVPEAPDVQILESTPERPSKIELWHTEAANHLIRLGFAIQCDSRVAGPLGIEEVAVIAV